MKRVHYAWVICLAGTLMIVCNMGLCSNILTTYLPFIEATGISGSQGSAILSIRCLFSLLSMFVVAAYYRKLSLRLGVFLATLMGAAGSLLFSVGGSAAVYFTAAAVCGVGYGFGSTIPMAILVKNWFSARQGLALGICAAGSGLATVIFSPILSAIAGRLSLGAAFRFQTCVFLLVGFCCCCWCGTRPGKRGWNPMGRGRPERL